jgi:hypothetical protein
MVGHAYHSGVGLQVEDFSYETGKTNCYPDYHSYSAECLCDTTYNLTPRNCNHPLKLWNFLFGVFWSNSFQEAIARINLVLEGEFDRIITKTKSIDNDFNFNFNFNFNFDYTAKYATGELT